MFSGYVEEIPVLASMVVSVSVGYGVEFGCTVVRFFSIAPFYIVFIGFGRL